MDFNDLENLSGAYAESRVLHTAVALDLFCAVAEGATAEQIADARQLNPRATELLLNAMAGMELLHKQAGMFTLAEVSRTYLLPDSPTYYGGMVGFEDDAWSQWALLPQAIKTGQAVRPPDMFQTDPETTRRFIMAMDSLVRARGDAEHIIDMLNLERVTTLLDVGSGPGTYPIAACRHHAHLQATIFDLPGTLEVTQEVLKRDGMSDRIALVPGNFNEDPLPGGMDMVMLSNIIHGENQPHNRALMKRCFNALNPGGRLVIKDHVLSPDRTQPVGGAVFSLHMLLVTRGRDYSLAEITAWLDDAGFAAATEHPLGAPFSSSLVVAEKPA